MRLFLALIVILGSLSSTLAVNPDEVLADPALEARARELSKELRCLVCQNQSIDDSDAELARDLRLIVRERLAAGDNDEDVIDYVVSRYGEFVLLKPRMGAHTILLWTGPFLLLGIGVVCVFVLLRRRNGLAASDEPRSAMLSEGEEKRLREILSDGN